MTDDAKPYGEQAARHAAQLTARTDATLDASTGTPVPLAPIGAALLLLAGLVLWRRPRNTAAAVGAVLGGLTLIAFGVWADHGVQRTAVNEVLTGIAVVAAALTAKVHR